MKKIVLLFLVILAGVASCSSMRSSSNKDKDSFGNTRSVEDGTISIPVNSYVTKIANYTAIDVEYYSSKEGKVLISGPQDVIDKILIEEKGQTIDIRVKPTANNIVQVRGVNIKVYLPSLNEVTLYASGNFKAENLSNTTMAVNLLGSGDLTVGRIDSTSLKLIIRGSGDIKVDDAYCTTAQFFTQGSGDIIVKSMESTTIKSNIQGSGDIKIGKLVCTRAETYIQGSGDVTYSNLEVNSLQTSIQGSGDFTADGHAFSANLTIQGSGTINIRGLKCDRVSKTKQGTGDILF
ncbi:MAG: DUF2807 domain-containing protein [Muribaculaceae bacterium]|nr:DUF2807 domain-containing protein [Muribaculaceae bacterium]